MSKGGDFYVGKLKAEKMGEIVEPPFEHWDSLLLTLHIVFPAATDAPVCIRLTYLSM